VPAIGNASSIPRRFSLTKGSEHCPPGFKDLVCIEPAPWKGADTHNSAMKIPAATADLDAHWGVCLRTLGVSRCFAGGE
jgi:hypothetical protein